MVLETSLFPFLGAPQFHEVVDFMKERRYVVYDVFDFKYRPIDGALAQVDVAFVKEDSSFRAIRSFRTPEQQKRNVEQKLRGRAEVVKGDGFLG